MCDYEFSLPFPPSVNAWKTPYKGRMILTSKGRDYRKRVADHMAKIDLANENISQRVSVRIMLYGPTNAKRDIDNFLKSPFDALSHCGFWEDDSQIDKLKITRCGKVKGGRLDICVTLLD